MCTKCMWLTINYYTNTRSLVTGINVTSLFTDLKSPSKQTKTKQTNHSVQKHSSC